MLLCPSMMCADFNRLGEEVDDLCRSGADMFHLDVMDGHFVPNYGLGIGDVKTICKRSLVPCDVHLMATHPADLVEIFIEAGADIVYVHPESDMTVNSTLAKINRLGASAGLVVDPGLSFASVEAMLPAARYVLVMTVNPGFAGQKYLDYVTTKIDQFVGAKQRYGYQVFIDGACSPQVVVDACKRGVDGAVLGTSSLFGKEKSYGEILSELHASCERATLGV